MPSRAAKPGKGYEHSASSGAEYGSGFPTASRVLPGREEVGEEPRRASRKLAMHKAQKHPHHGQALGRPRLLLCPAAGAGWKPHVCSDKASTKLPFWHLPLGNREGDPQSTSVHPIKIIPNLYLYQGNLFCYTTLTIPSIRGNLPPPNHHCNSPLLPSSCNALLLFLTTGPPIPFYEAWSYPQPVPLSTHGSSTPLSKASSKGTSPNSFSPLQPDHQVLKYRTLTDVQAKIKSRATPFQKREVWQGREQEQDYAWCVPNQQ